MPNYPASLDSLANPAATTRRNDPGFELHTVISTLNDIAEQVEAKLGIGASTPSARGLLVGGASAGQSAWVSSLILALQASPGAPGAGLGLVYPDLNGVWQALAGASPVPSVVGPRDEPLTPNGGAEVWQRGTPIAVAASTSSAVGYGPDRWCLATNANQACTWTRASGLTTDSQFAAQVGRNAGQTGVGTLVAEQPYETADVAKFRGKPVAVRFDAKAGANWSPSAGNLTVAVRSGTGAESRRGAGFTAETVLLSQTVPLAAGSQNLALVGSVLVPSNATQMSLAFEWTPTGTAGADDTFTFDNVKLSSGAIAQPYVPRAYGLDFVACRRYYQELGTPGAGDFLVSGYTTAGNQNFPTFPLTVPMRTSPSVAFGGVTWTLANTPTNPTVTATGPNSIVLGVISTATGLAYALNSVAGARVVLNAEM